MMFSPFKSEFYVSQAFKGAGVNSPHRGVDLVSFGPDKSLYIPPNTPVAIVDHVGWENRFNPKQGYGFYVRVKATVNNRPWYLIFGHLVADSATVKVGQTVKVGDKIGTMGNTGASQFPHVHLEIRLDVPGVYGVNENVAEFYNIPNAYENMKHLKSDWPVQPVTPEPRTKKVIGTGVAKSKDASLAGKYEVRQGSWNFRNGPSVTEKTLVVLRGSDKDTARSYGYYTDFLGTRWLYAVVNKGGVEYTGFISTKALKKV